MTQNREVSALQPRRLDRFTGPFRARRRGGRRARVVRRAVAVLLLLAAAAVTLVRPESDRPGVVAVAVSHDLAAGDVLGDDDLQLRTVPAVPDGALTDRAAARGRTLSGAIRRGELLTDAAVVATGGPDPGPGRVAVPIRLADPAAAALLQPGVHVAVLVVDDGGSPRRLTADAVVLAVPGTATASQNGNRIGVSAGESGRLAILAVPESDADQLAAAALAGDIAVRFT
ncbi:SAF domain-containing protein [Nakamurella lactea]|uniref:SAF domain-containing protein n=1 Tax=Nakamurella lactea TaxID=459515 RepID=UPI000406591C|nr:SAF domain-containing protein [Nakamurella lactea]